VGSAHAAAGVQGRASRRRGSLPAAATFHSLCNPRTRQHGCRHHHATWTERVRRLERASGFRNCRPPCKVALPAQPPTGWDYYRPSPLRYVVLFSDKKITYEYVFFQLCFASGYCSAGNAPGSAPPSLSGTSVLPPHSWPCRVHCTGAEEAAWESAAAASATACCATCVAGNETSASPLLVLAAGAAGASVGAGACQEGTVAGMVRTQRQRSVSARGNALTVRCVRRTFSRSSWRGLP
jgi:hypothetical protein